MLELLKTYWSLVILLIDLKRSTTYCTRVLWKRQHDRIALHSTALVNIAYGMLHKHFSPNNVAPHHLLNKLVVEMCVLFYPPCPLPRLVGIAIVNLNFVVTVVCAGYIRMPQKLNSGVISILECFCMVLNVLQCSNRAEQSHYILRSDMTLCSVLR